MTNKQEKLITPSKTWKVLKNMFKNYPKIEFCKGVSKDTAGYVPVMPIVKLKGEIGKEKIVLERTKTTSTVGIFHEICHILYFDPDKLFNNLNCLLLEEDNNNNIDFTPCKLTEPLISAANGVREDCEGCVVDLETGFYEDVLGFPIEPYLDKMTQENYGHIFNSVHEDHKFYERRRKQRVKETLKIWKDLNLNCGEM